MGGRGKLALLLLLSPAPFACCSAKTPSAGDKRGQKYICSVMKEQNSTWSSGSAEQRCAEAQRCSLHSRTLPATTQPQQLHPLPPPLCPARRECPAPTMISLSVLRSGPSHCITSHLHFSLWPSHHHAETLSSRQGSSLCLWIHFQGQLLLQAKPGTLLLLIAAVLCCGERH